MSHSPSADTPADVPVWALVAAALLSGLVAAGGMLSQPALLALGAVGTLALGFRYPQALLLLAIAWIPFTASLSGGERRGGFLLAFGVSDVLLLAAIPGIVWYAWQRYKPSDGRADNSDTRAGQALPLRGNRLPLAIGLYLTAGLLSFLLNLPAMGGEAVSYFLGFARTLQIVFLLPLCFACIEWNERSLRWLCAVYLFAIGVLALGSVIGFRTEGAFRVAVMGNHKNVAGLALATGALIALSVVTQPGLMLHRFARIGLVGLAFLSAIAVGMLFARSSILCLAAGALALALMRRRPLLFVAPTLLAAVALFTALAVSPANIQDGGITLENPSVRGRSQQFEKSWQAFRAHPILGDGFRTRRDSHPHNMVMTILAENGIIGLILFGWVLMAQAQLFGQARKAFAENPQLAALCVALIACNIAVLLHAQFDPFWRRGPLWLPWAGTGILIGIQVFGYSGVQVLERGANLKSVAGDGGPAD